MGAKYDFDSIYADMTRTDYENLVRVFDENFGHLVILEKMIIWIQIYYNFIFDLVYLYRNLNDIHDYICDKLSKLSKI